MSSFGFVTCVDLGVSSLSAFLEFSDIHDVRFIATLPPDLATSKVGRTFSLTRLAELLESQLIYLRHVDELVSLDLPSVDYL